MAGGLQRYRRSPAVSRAEDALAEGKVALPDEAIDWGQPPVPEPLAGTSAHPSTIELHTHQQFNYIQT